jgi:hypothetical protein
MNIKLPFPEWTLTTDAKIYQRKSNRDGGNDDAEFFSGKVRFDKKTKQIMNERRELIALSGMIVCKGDIYLPEMTQETPLFVSVEGMEKRVYSVNKPDNPDGSIFSTELSLI